MVPNGTGCVPSKVPNGYITQVWHCYRPLSIDLSNILVYPPWLLDLGTHQNLLHRKIHNGIHQKMEHTWGMSTEDEKTYLDVLRLQSNYATRVDHKKSIKGTTLFTPMKRIQQMGVPMTSLNRLWSLCPTINHISILKHRSRCYVGSPAIYTEHVLTDQMQWNYSKCKGE